MPSADVKKNMGNATPRLVIVVGNFFGLRMLGRAPPSKKVPRRREEKSISVA